MLNKKIKSTCSVRPMCFFHRRRKVLKVLAGQAKNANCIIFPNFATIFNIFPGLF